MASDELWNAYEKYVRRTKPEAFMLEVKVRAGKMIRRTRNAMHCRARKVYVSARVLKHLYDRKPAEEFDFILDNLARIIRGADCVYKNKMNKTGNFCLVGQMGTYRYLVALEIVVRSGVQEEVHVVTAFRIGDEKYLRNYELLRSWRDGAHSS